jgi:hypothetical protein
VRGSSFAQAGMPFDFVYVDQSWEKVLLVKEGLKAPADKIGVIFRDQKVGAFLFHFQMDGSSYVVMALGFSSDELFKVLAPFQPKKSYSKWTLLFNSAYAMDTDCDTQMRIQKSLAANSAALEDGMVLRTIGKCGADAWQGVKQSATDTLDFFKKLATDPQALWGEMKESFLQLKEFALNIKSEMNSLLITLRNMPTEQKMQVVCTMTGELIAGAAQAALAAGSLAKTVPLLLEKLRKSMALLSKLGELRKMGVKTPDLNLATKEILSCAY